MQVTDCSFLYFNRHLLEAGLKDFLEQPHEARKIFSIIAAFSDGHRLLAHSSMISTATHKVCSHLS